MRTFSAPDLRALTVRHELGAWLNACGLTGKGVEVGTLYGTYAQQIIDSWKGHLFCVDPWENQSPEIYHDGQNLVDLPAMFQQVSQSIGQHPRCTLLRMLSLNAVGQFQDGELSFVYLDGNHSLESVRADIAAWWPKIKIGGLMCGHDYFTRYDDDTNSDAATAINELADAIGVKPHVTWCTSWYFVKTAIADERFKSWHTVHGDGQALHPAFTDNRELDLVVVLPVAKFDWNLAKKWLAFVDSFGSESSFTMLILCSPDLTEAHKDQLKLRPKWHVETANITERGYFGSPNQMIKAGLEWCERQFPTYAMLWCEADTVPMRASWFREIRDEYRACGRPFMGDILQGPIVHMTGNGVYHPDWRRIAPSLGMLGQEQCGWDTLCAHEILPRAHQAKTIQQIWRPRLPITKEWAAANIRPETALFHQCKDGSLIDVQCELLGAPKIPLDAALCESTYDRDRGTLARHGPVGSIGPAKKHHPVSPTIIVSSAYAFSMEILIVTFKRDMAYLKNCLQSIDKFATGFTGVTLVVPSSERGLYDSIGHAKIKYFDEVADKGMLHHMIQKCRADEWCPQAQSILLMDADCMFWQKVTPGDYSAGGKLMLVREKYEGIANPNRMLWQGCVERAVGWKPEYETMVRHPSVHRREVFAKTRQLVEAHTKKQFDTYVLNQENAFPQGFAEIPTLGAVAIRFFAEDYAMIDYDRNRDAQECGVDAKTAWQYLYRKGRDSMVEFWGHAQWSRYASDANAFLQKRVPPFYVK
jgi:hypothetical protein